MAKNNIWHLSKTAKNKNVAGEALMLNWIFGKLDGTLIVTREGTEMLLLEFNL